MHPIKLLVEAVTHNGPGNLHIAPILHICWAHRGFSSRPVISAKHGDWLIWSDFPFSPPHTHTFPPTTHSSVCVYPPGSSVLRGTRQRNDQKIMTRTFDNVERRTAKWGFKEIPSSQLWVWCSKHTTRKMCGLCSKGLRVLLPGLSWDEGSDFRSGTRYISCGGRESETESVFVCLCVCVTCS